MAGAALVRLITISGASLMIAMCPVAAKQPPAANVEFVEAHDCRALPAQAVRLCKSVTYAKTRREKGSFSYAWIDADGDGDRDLVVRRSSLVDCGTLGCSTDVLFRQSRNYLVTTPPLVTFGRVERCRDYKGWGLRFGDRGLPGACLHFKARD